MNTNPSHILGIDAIRFLAAVAVMFFHYGFWAGFTRETDISQVVVSYPKLSSLTSFGWVGVQTFFVISGFVIAFSSERASAFKFWVSRVVRLLPGVVICASITLLALSWIEHASFEDLMKLYVKSITFWPTGPWVDDSYWTLAIEISFYCTVFGLLVINKFKWIRPLAITLGLISTAFTVVSFASMLPYFSTAGNIIGIVKNLRIADLLLLNHGVFFALGILFWLELVKEHHAHNIGYLGGFTAIGCLHIYLVTVEFNNSGAGIAPLVPILIWLVSLAGIIFSVRMNPEILQLPLWLRAFLRRIGLMTYPLYLIHQSVGLALIGSLLLAETHRHLALSIAITLSLTISWIVSVYLEPPLQAKLKRLSYQLKPDWMN